MLQSQQSTIPTEMDFVVVLGFKAGALFISVRFFLGLSAAQRKFAHSLRDFKFEFIGDAETDDERCIGKKGVRSGLLSSATPSTNSPCLSPYRCFLTGIFQLFEES